MDFNEKVSLLYLLTPTKEREGDFAISKFSMCANPLLVI